VDVELTHHPSADLVVAPPHVAKPAAEFALAWHRARQCLPDLIEPVYVPRLVLFLASDDAAMCTANNYMIEAGSI
jgi:hypothetical protein